MVRDVFAPRGCGRECVCASSRASRGARLDHRARGSVRFAGRGGSSVNRSAGQIDRARHLKSAKRSVVPTAGASLSSQRFGESSVGRDVRRGGRARCLTRAERASTTIGSVRDVAFEASRSPGARRSCRSHRARALDPPPGSRAASALSFAFAIPGSSAIGERRSRPSTRSPPRPDLARRIISQERVARVNAT
jgi:hypothetical protein